MKFSLDPVFNWIKKFLYEMEKKNFIDRKSKIVITEKDKELFKKFCSEDVSLYERILYEHPEKIENIDLENTRFSEAIAKRMQETLSTSEVSKDEKKFCAKVLFYILNQYKNLDSLYLIETLNVLERCLGENLELLSEENEALKETIESIHRSHQKAKNKVNLP